MCPAIAASDKQHAQALTDLHGHWNWDLVVKDVLQPFGYVTPQMLESAVRACGDGRKALRGLPRGAPGWDPGVLNGGCGSLSHHLPPAERGAAAHACTGAAPRE